MPGNASAASSPSIAKLLTSYDYQWTEPEALSKIVNFALYNFYPRVSDDGLEMWFSANGGKAAADTGAGERRAVDHTGANRWPTRGKSPSMPAAPINSGKSEKDFTLTADRLQIIWYRSLYLQLSSRAARRQTLVRPGTRREGQLWSLPRFFARWAHAVLFAGDWEGFASRARNLRLHAAMARRIVLAFCRVAGANQFRQE